VEPVWANATEISEARVGAGYDIVFVGSLLVHLADPIGCLARIKQVLKPGGVCIIANPIGRSVTRSVLLRRQKHRTPIRHAVVHATR
jgi:2-polyprenyl-3-methyl-5-hydroxy-6-metoxy-1,4-benzoquinol methylase